MPRRFRRTLIGVFVYLVVCTVGGVYLADGTLHPGRRPLTDDEVAQVQRSARELDAELEDSSITTADAVRLRGWTLRPHPGNGDAVILLHGLGDNRLGMIGYAQLLLRHGFTVLMPDARGHGVSGGQLVTYGLIERNDIHHWFDFLQASEHPRCIFGMGESMGAAELLQSLSAGTRFCAVVAESPFATFREIGYDRMGQPFHLGPWVGWSVLRPVIEVAFLRARWTYGLRLWDVSPEDSVAATKIPVLLIHGQVDSNIPVRHSRMIHALASGSEIWEVPGADHCGAISMAPRVFEERLVGWFGVASPLRVQWRQGKAFNR